MKPEVLTYLMKLIAVGVQVKNGGLTDELRAELSALVAEGQDSILEPQDDGQPWTEEAILRWKAEHDSITAQIRDRHNGN